MSLFQRLASIQIGLMKFNVCFAMVQVKKHKLKVHVCANQDKLIE